MDDITTESFANYRLENAKEALSSAELLYKYKKYKAANNRAYYSIFYAIRAVLALEHKDFKRHKDVIAYFNKNYVHTEIFPRMMGTKISHATEIREDSDYDDEFIVKPEETVKQIETAKELIELVEKYLKEKNKKQMLVPTI